MHVINPESPEVEVGIKRLNHAKVKFPDTALDIQLHFGYHGLADHVSPELEAGLQEADIFCLETVGWSKEGKEMIESVAQGDEEALRELYYRAANSRQEEFWRALHQALFGSQVAVHYPDVPEGHALAAQYTRATDQELELQARLEALLSLGREIPSGEELEQATRPLFTNYNKRDEYILKHFFPKELPDQEEVKIVAFFGALHEGIAVALAWQAIQQGRDNVRVSRNDFDAPFGLTEAYDDFLQQRPPVQEHLVRFLTDRFD